jgi:hypothetical protein
LTLNQPVPEAEKYIVYYGAQSQEFNASDGIDFTITGLDPNCSYTFTAQAVIGGNETTDGPSKKVRTKK